MIAHHSEIISGDCNGDLLSSDELKKITDFFKKRRGLINFVIIGPYPAGGMKYINLKYFKWVFGVPFSSKRGVLCLFLITRSIFIGLTCS